MIHRDDCLYCGTELVTVRNTPHRDLAWGGALRVCPVCESDFHGRVNPPEVPKGLSAAEKARRKEAASVPPSRSS